LTGSFSVSGLAAAHAEARVAVAEAVQRPEAAAEAPIPAPAAAVPGPSAADPNRGRRLLRLQPKKLASLPPVSVCDFRVFVAFIIWLFIRTGKKKKKEK